MAYEACRLCGIKKHPSELAATLDDRSADVTLDDLVRYFARIELSNNPKFGRKVCDSCQNEILHFLNFSDGIDRHQKELESLHIIKAEKLDECVVKPKYLLNPANVMHLESNQVTHPVDSAIGMSDEDLDSPLSEDQFDEIASLVNGYAESTASFQSNSTVSYATRGKPIPELKPCFIALEKLEIDYVQSDTESDNDEPLITGPRGIKRPRSSGAQEISPSKSLSPSKRMRFAIPHHVAETTESEGEERVLLTVAAQVVKEIKFNGKCLTEEVNNPNNKEFFEAVLTEDECRAVMTFKTPFKIDQDGSVTPEYASRFPMWNSVKLKCLIEPCEETFSSPFHLLTHKKISHPECTSSKFIECPLCPLELLGGITFQFSEFFKHVYEVHSLHYRYCCINCPKIFCSFITLFNHCQNYHPELRKIHMCIYDGLMFDNHAGFRRHASVHEKKPIIKNEPTARAVLILAEPTG